MKSEVKVKVTQNGAPNLGFLLEMTLALCSRQDYISGTKYIGGYVVFAFSIILFVNFFSVKDFSATT